MSSFRRSFKWSSDNKKTITVAVPRSEAGFGFTVAWTKPPLVDYIHEGGNAEKAGLMPGDKIICIDKIKVSKKGKEEVENIVKNAKEIMELEVLRPESEVATRKRQTSLRRKESFTKKGSKMIIQDCNIMLWRRERAMLKLLLCEEDLLTSIAHGKERFILLLRKRCTLSTPMELNILFGNMDEISSVHERYVQQLRQMTQGNDDCIGRLYQKQLDERCNVLKTYVYGLHLAKILLRYKLSNKPFRKLIEEREKEEGTLELIKFIDRPVQYIAEITSQLETLLSCTAVGHRDYVCLESVVAVLKNFGREMNEVISKLSCFVDFDEIESSFNDEEPYINLETLQEKAIFTKGPRNFSLVYPGRYWLFCGELSKVEGRHYTQYWALLLSDCLILTRRTEQRVLLVLDEPVMLRSIYQATFDIKKCDTEFRILFALENTKKLAGQRNQWLTWILRAPSVGVKLLWQTILTYQLSFYSSEALSSGSKASFVHSRPMPGIKELAAKKNLKYDESSFMNIERSHIQSPLPGISKVHRKSIEGSIQPKSGKIILPVPKTSDLLKEISEKKSKERSYFSLDENVISPSSSEENSDAFPRSISFGNDISDNIPYIDTLDENNVDQNDANANEIEQPNKCESETQVEEEDIADIEADKCPAESASVPNTPSKSDKYVQTDDSSESSETVRRTPKRRFPRLGTFERIKIEKKQAAESSTSPPASGPPTRTTFRQRRHIKTTVSKEMLLKATAVSPSNDEQSPPPESPPPNEEAPTSEKRKSKGLFSRFWKRESKSPEIIAVQTVQTADKGVQESNLDEAPTIERPPDYESAMRSGTSWVPSTETTEEKSDF